MDQIRITDLPSIGQPLQAGFYGGTIRIGNDLFAFEWAPRAPGETKAVWLPSYTQVPNAASCFDSMANTVAMAEAGSPLANWARGLDIGGKTDWCVPARDLLELGYRHLKPTDEDTCCSFRDGDNPSSVPVGYPYLEGQVVKTNVEAFQEGAAEAFEDALYWSSTQYSDDYAWCQGFYDGFQGYGSKSAQLCARAVRLIQLVP